MEKNTTIKMFVYKGGKLNIGVSALELKFMCSTDKIKVNPSSPTTNHITKHCKLDHLTSIAFD